LLTPPSAESATIREYWIAAVPVTWNVVPNGRNAIEKEVFDPTKTTIQTVVYKAFTPRWRKPLPDVPWVAGDNDGIPGPLIRAKVGDRVLVHFKNMDTLFKRPHSMHFHAFFYQFGSDGSFIPGFSGRGGSVKPGQTFTYRLVARPDSVGVWPYHDHSPSMHESIAGGLYGAISIADPAEERPDKEFVVFFSALAGFETINGRAFVGNTPVLHARVGDLVQWDVLAIGDEHHTFHVHGHRWRDASGTPEDTKTLGPAESFRVRFREDVPGTWLYHCHVEGHMAQGMIGLYRVRR
jgi:FtsP/CotA-like multicopper oxidase with cupredoxin domain